MGGHSAEREISLKSGTMVLSALRKSGVDAHAFDPRDSGLEELKAQRFERVFIALHGRLGEDGTVQGALEYLGMPYTGSGVMASALAMDKWRTKLLWQAAGLPTPAWELVTARTDPAGLAARLKLPLMMKPAREGSSIGMSKVTSVEKIAPARELAARYDARDLKTQDLAIYTSLDFSLQSLAQSVLTSGLQRVEKMIRRKSKEGPLQGCLIALEPRTGAIVALVGGRSYGTSQYNRVTSARRQPGSTFKPLVMAAALDCGAVKASERFDCDDGKIGRRRIHEDEGHRYGVLDATGIIARSSNIGMAKVGLRLGVTYSEHARNFSSPLFPDYASRSSTVAALVDATYDLTRTRVRPYLLGGLAVHRTSGWRRHDDADRMQFTYLGASPMVGAGVRFRFGTAEAFTEMRLHFGMGGQRGGMGLPLTFGIRF